MKKFILVYISIFLILVSTGCQELDLSNEEIKDIIDNEYSTQVERILHSALVDSKIIVFYEATDGLRHCIIGMHNKEWVILGGSSNTPLSSEDGITWGMENDDILNILVYSGIITDDRITHINVAQNSQSQSATIVNSNGIRLWYVVFDHHERPKKSEPNILKIEGTTSDNELLFTGG